MRFLAIAFAGLERPREHEVHVARRAGAFDDVVVAMAVEGDAVLDTPAYRVVTQLLSFMLSNGARRTPVRVAAINNPDSAVRDLLGSEPPNQRERLAWRKAVEATAVYSARYSRRAGFSNGSARERLLGDRPASHQAARAYDQPHERSTPS